MNGDKRLLFQSWAAEQKLPLEGYFFEDEDTYDNTCTQLAWDAWCAGADPVPAEREMNRFNDGRTRVSWIAFAAFLFGLGIGAALT